MKKPKIVIVDDVEALLTLLKDVLEKEFSVRTFEHGDIKTLKSIHKNPPDIICCDIQNAPSGFEFIENVRKKHSMPIIVLTAHQDTKINAECIKIGANAVLVKPYEIDQLTTLIKFYLNEGKNSVRKTSVVTA